MHRRATAAASTAALTVLLLATAAGAAERLEVPYSTFRLANGLAVVVHEDHSVPIVAVNTWYHVGSSREQPGRTGLAHLFEHLMFEGSKNVPEGAFDRWLEAVGGNNNATTSEDRTNYFESGPASALELMLFLESDRMAYLPDTMTPEKVNGQRSVVKNERRQRNENAPYGMAEIYLADALFPPGHPYHWPVIGSMEDLDAASHEDIAQFFRRWYAPSNAVLVIAGDVETAEVRPLVEKWFSDVPAREAPEPMGTRPIRLDAEKRLVHEEDVQLPRLYLHWATPPHFAPEDAALDAVAGVLAGGKNSRLYKRLVYDLQIAQDVSAYQASAHLASTFDVVVTAREGTNLEKMRAIVDEEIAALQAKPPAERELERFLNQQEASFLSRLETVAGKADQLNGYLFAAGDPDYFEEDIARYRALSPTDVQFAAQRHLGPGRVALSIVPRGKTSLALDKSEVVR
jgi:zinc protease